MRRAQIFFDTVKTSNLHALLCPTRNEKCVKLLAPFTTGIWQISHKSEPDTWKGSPICSFHTPRIRYLIMRTTCLMADIWNKKKRSEVMSLIRSSGNKDTELKLAAILRSAGIVGWRRHQPLLGRPDFTFRRARLAVFVDGCFWHGCPKHGRKPRSNRAYWLPKLRRNRERDASVKRTLSVAGWTVIRLWEHDLAKPQRAVSRIKRALDRAHNRLNFSSR